MKKILISKITNIFFLPMIFLVLFSGIDHSIGQTIPEEARRHMARGEMAMEMATSPDGYEAAIIEFKEAARFAPRWPQAYYKMGLAQEKAGKYGDAVISLKKYLQLTPKSPDAPKIKEKIYKLEYKAEKVLALADISDILSSFAKWEKRGQCRFDNMMFENIKKVNPDSVRVIAFADGSRGLKFAILNVEGPIFKFTAKIRNWDYQDPGLRSMYGIEPDLLENQIEVVSREHVIVRQKHLFNQTAAQRLGTQQIVGSCEYFKK